METSLDIGVSFGYGAMVAGQSREGRLQSWWSKLFRRRKKGWGWEKWEKTAKG